MISLILITLILTPAYILRFNLSEIPTNLLMLWVFFVWAVFFWQLMGKKQLHDFYQFSKKLDKKLLVFISLFFLAGLISLFVKGFDIKKLGQFIVLFLQPISIFFIARYVFSQNPKAKNLLLTTCYLLLAISGLYAILQYFTLLSLPPAWWGNSVEPKRALSFFTHPNFYALWSAPLLALLIPDLIARAKGVGLRAKLPVIGWLIGGIGLLLSLSRAGWLGLGVAVGVYIIVAADKKIRKAALITGVLAIIIIAAVPNLRWRFTLPFYGEKSAVSRLSLWDTGTKAIKESPVTGLGLTGFSQNWTRLNTDPNLDPHNFPHNIFLDFWVETGILGLISFIGIIFIFIKQGIKNRQDIFKLGISLFLIAILFQGLIDNPYFKNDLAMTFWMVLALAI